MNGYSRTVSLASSAARQFLRSASVFLLALLLIAMSGTAALASPQPSGSSVPLLAAAPTAAGQAATTAEETSVTVTLSASDVDSPSLTFAIVAQPGHGTLGTIGAPSCTANGAGSTCTATVSYTPNVDFYGSDSFTFRAYDGSLYSAPAAVTITVTNVNDAPGLNTAISPTLRAIPEEVAPASNSGDLVSAITNGGFITDADSAYGGPNRALGRPAAASSTINASSYGASEAVDGEYYHRWISASSNPQWIYVDLGQTYYVSRVVLTWAYCWGVTYQIQMSNDASNWTTIYSTNSGGGSTNDVDDIPGLSGTGRYVRIYGTQYGGSGGYELREFEVYGAVAVNGLAVTAVDNANGVWQFSADSGAAWSEISPSGNPVSETSALLLAADATTKVRFLPNANFIGQSTLTVRAWDQTSGSAGDRTSTTSNGGWTAFSAATGTVGITVNAVAPTVASQVVTTTEDTSLDITLSANHAGPSSQTRFEIVTQPSHGTLGTVGDPTCAVADGSSSCTATVTYTPNPDYAWTDSFTFRAYDAAGLPSNTATASITVTNVNDAPVLNTAINPILTTIPEEVASASNPGNLVSSYTLNGYITDADSAFGGPNRALGKSATASSIISNDWSYDYAYGPSKVVDGNPTSRWISANSNPQWIRIDLGQTYYISEVILRWDDGPGTAYQIQVSNDAATWTTIYSTTTGDGGVDDLTGLTGIGRYIRMYGTQYTGSPYGYELGEFEVYGAVAVNGLAVTAVDNANGVWQFSTDNGANWAPIAPVSVDSALLLAADATTKVRFLPNPNFFGQATMTVRAWDQSSGSAGEKTSTISNGGSTAFSIAEDSISITVSRVDPVAAFGTVTTAEETAVVVTLSASHTGDDSQTRFEIVTQPSHGTLGPVSAPSCSVTDGVLGCTATVTYTPSANYFWIDPFTYRVYDGIVYSGAATETVWVTNVNDAPVLHTAASPTLAAVNADAVGGNPGTLVSSIANTSNFITDADNGSPLPFAASSARWSDSQAAAAFDGNMQTRWESDWADPQWIMADLGQTSYISRVVLYWEAAYATAYRIQVSDNPADPTSWRDIYSTTTGNGGTDDLTGLSGIGRFIRMYGTQRVPPGWGYSIWEFQIYRVPLKGLAITSADNTNGVWQYCTNGTCANDTDWLEISPSGNPVSDTSALLLAGDPNTKARFAPKSDWFGQATMTVRAWDLSAGSALGRADTSTTHNGGSTAFSSLTDTVSITVNPVAPVAAFGTATTAEDTAVTVTLSATDADSPSLSRFEIVAQPSHGSLGPISTPACTETGTGSACTATVSYTPSANYFWLDTFTFRAYDGVLYSGAATVSISITNVNDAPVLNTAVSPTLTAVNENAAADSIGGTSLSTIANTSGFVTDADNSGSVPATASSNQGSWVAANAFDGNSGTRWASDWSDPQWIMVDLGQTSYIYGVTLTWETAYARSYQIQVSDDPVDPMSWRSIYSTTTGDGGTDTLTGLSGIGRFVRMYGIQRGTGYGYSLYEFQVFRTAPFKGLAITGVDNGNGTWQYSINGGADWSEISPSGSPVSETSALLLAGDPNTKVRFVPNADVYGQAAMTVRAWDLSAGSVLDRADTSATHNGGSTAFSTESDTVSITVNFVNRPPSFAKGTDLTVDEDSGAYSGAWATGISTGPAGEPAQTVSFLVDSNSNPMLFSAGPAVATDGTLTFTPAANAYGTATIGVKARDSGGMAYGGVDTSAAQTFTITVNAVNDAPVLNTAINPTLTPIDEDVAPASNGGTRVSAVTDVSNYIADGDSWVPNLALNRPVTASSAYSSAYPASHAVDGSTTTRWASAQSGGTESIYVDLGTSYTISQVVLRWEAAYAKSYQVQVSDDAATWTTIYSTTTGDGGTDVLTGLSGTGRYVRMLGTVPWTTSNGGYSLWEFEVYPSSAVQKGLAVTAADNANGSWQYSTDSGATWSAIGSVSDASALLLTPANRVRFQPNADYFGSVSLTVRAWDQTSGTMGTKVDVTANGGSTAFSAATDTVGITVNNVNDAPVLHTDINPTLTAIAENVTAASNPGDPISVITSTPGFITDVDDAPLIPGGPNRALNRPVTVSTTFGAGYEASKALDGNATTRWASAQSGGTESIYVDLGASCSISEVVLNWEAAYAKTYKVQVSDDAVTWTDIYSTTSGNGGVDDLTGLSGTGRYVRMLGTVPWTTGGGYSLWEFEVYGSLRPRGLAVVGTGADDSSHGIWQYSTDRGTTWNAIGSVSDASALLLTPANKVRFQPNADYFGTASLTVRAWDQTEGSVGPGYTIAATGGTTAFSTESDTVGITVNFVNRPPSFTKGADVTVNEDSGAYSAAWATGISAGPASEPAQTVGFLVDSNSNPTLFSLAPSVDAAGTLTFTPAPNANGVATIGVKVQDTGGTANGGVDTSAVQTFVITVNPVNDVPFFVKGADVTVDENSGPYSAAWATGIYAGPANESSQILSFIIESNSNSGLFSAGPAVSSNGTLTFATAADAYGTATIGVKVQDNGGTANGGVDTSAVQTLVITLNPTNRAPTDINLSPDSVPENQPAGTAVGTLSASDPDKGDSATFSLELGDGSADNASFTIDGSTLKTNASFNFEVKPSYSIRVRATDLGGLTFEKALAIAISNTNDAPELNRYLTLRGANIDEDPSSNPGTLVSTILRSPKTGQNAISDEDADAAQGIAVYDASCYDYDISMAGTWEYTTDGSTWISFGSPTTTTARLLPSDASTGVRFVPLPDWSSGAAPCVILYVAWDRTSGTAGGTAELGAGGGTSAFSEDGSGFYTMVTPVNDPPAFTLSGDVTVDEDFATEQSVTVTPGPVPYGEGLQTVTYSLSPASVAFANVSIDSATGKVKITSLPNGNGTRTLTVTANDGQLQNNTYTRTFTLTVRPVNDQPALATIGDKAIAWGDTLRFTASATDVDGPADTLTYSLVAHGTSPVPDGASIEATSGAFSWLPTADQIGSHTFDVKVCDSGSPALCDQKAVTVVVGERMATVTLGSLSQTYDGTPRAATATTDPAGLAVSFTYTQNGSAIVPINAGDYAVVATVTDSRYLGDASGTLTVAPKDASVTAADKSKTYGEDNPALTATVVGAVPGGSAINYTLSTTAVKLSNVGAYPITVALGSNPNYNVAVVNGTLTISPKAASVTADAKSKTYGDPNPTLTATVVGAVPGGDTVKYTLTTTAVPCSNVGGYPIAVTPGDNPNYDVTKADSTLSVTARTASVTADNKAKTYGDANPDLTATVTGQAAGCDAVKHTLATVATNTSGVGKYPITVTLGSNPNYSVTPTDGTLTINPATLTVKADNQTAQYSDPVSGAFTFTYSGWVNNEGPSVLTTAPTCTTTRKLPDLPGPYPITCSGGVDENYTFNYVTGTLTVTKEAATVAYTGDTQVTTARAGANATVTLAATLEEDQDNSFGNQLAGQRGLFQVYNFGGTLLTSCEATIGNVANGRGYGSCTVSLQAADPYTVKITLNDNSYYTASVEDVAVLVNDPGTGMAVGGGWVTDPTSKTRASLGITTKFLKSGGVQGNSLYIYRVTTDLSKLVTGAPIGQRAYNWIVKSNAMSSLNIYMLDSTGKAIPCPTTVKSGCRATITGKNTIQAVDRLTGTVYSLGGNYQFQVDVTDNREAGSPSTAPSDQYAIRVWNASGVYYQLGSTYDANGKLLAPLSIGGGNVQVKPK